MSEQPDLPDEELDLSEQDAADLKGMYDNSFGQKSGPVEQMVPVSEVERIIREMQLDIQTRSNAVSFALQALGSSDVNALLTAAKNIENYITQGTTPSE